MHIFHIDYKLQRAKGRMCMRARARIWVCFRGGRSRATPLSGVWRAPAASRCRMRCCRWYAVASLSYHPCSPAATSVVLGGQVGEIRRDQLVVDRAVLAEPADG
jgi:hypothetical protein